MIIIENRTVPCNPRSKNYAKGTVVNVSGAASTSAFVYTPTYDEIINTLKNGKDYITIPTILEVYGDLYSLGEVSAFGAGSGGSSGGGLIQTVYGYSSLGGTFDNDTLADTFNAYTINKINSDLNSRITSLESGSSGGGLIQTVYGYSSLGSAFNNTTLTDTFNAYTINQLHTRLSQVELGAAVNVAVSGTGNAITGITKNGNVLEFTKGLTFSLDGHTHNYIPLSQKGTANGVASLDANGLIISAQLPSYVDDVIEVSTYANLPVSGESGKIYVTTDTNITYRWTGTIYVEISKSIALGETSSTAYRGDLGVIAYAHSQIAGGIGVHVSSTERTNWNLAYTNSHTHTNKSVLDGITSALISNWDTAYTNSHTHANKSLLDAFSQSDNDVLNHLSIVDGKLKVDIDLYSLGEVSAFGAGAGSGGSGLIQTVYGYSGLGGTYNDATLTDTFNAYTINKINADLGARITSLESGSALTFTTVGSGNAVTSVTKSGTSVTVTKGLTFSVDGHTHTFASLTSKPTTLSGYGITDGLLASAYTATDVLNKIKTVDGSGSGLDADLLDGINSSEYDHNYYIGYRPDYVNVVILLFDINAITIHRINGRFYSTSNGSGRYTSTDVDIWYSRWSSTYFDRSINVFNKSSFGSLDLVTCVYNGITYLALKYDDSVTEKSWYFNGTESESFTMVEYYNSQTSTIINSEIYNSLTDANSWNTYNIRHGAKSFAYTDSNVESANRLQTARTIAGVRFDGSDNIAIPFANLSSIPTTIGGYGITDAYTKTQTDSFLALKLDVATFSDLFEKVNIGTTDSPVYAIKAKYNFYSLGEVSAFGAGSGTGGSGLIQTVYGYSGLGGTYNDVTLTDTFNAYTINKINTDLSTRITSLGSGSALTFTTAGSGNAVTSVTKSGTSVTVTKGLTFSVDGHTHSYLPLSGGALTGTLTSPKILINKAGNVASGISWYNSTYNAWQDYMADTGSTGNGVNANITAPSGTLVTTWARRSFIENAGGFGWTFESGTNSSTTPSVVAEIRASDGAAKFGGTVTAPTFSGALSGNASTATKLATIRTIWGQNFNGEDNVSGALNGATTGSFSGLLSSVGLTVTNTGTNRAVITQMSIGDVPTDFILGSNNANRWSIAGRDSSESYSFGIFNFGRGSYDIFIAGSTGNVGIGNNNTPAYKLDVAGTLRATEYVTGSRFYTGYDSGQANSMSCSNWFISSGASGWYNGTYGGGINMTDSTYVRVYNGKAFWVDNNIVATGEITAFGASDIRLKSNIKQIDSALDFLSKVKTYEFDWNEKAIELNPLKAKRGAGVIAQEMSLLDNNFVHSIYGDYLGVDYERFIPYLIGGVNEVADEVTILKNRVAELELEVKRLSA